MKRLFDIVSSIIGLLILLPLFIVMAILVKIDSKGPVFFRQERIGKNFKPFRIYKFRTMKVNAEDMGPLVTVSGDKRITILGNFLRKYKLDELPQLFNVIKGDMSIVGPRPEVKKYVELFNSDYKKLLKIRPGMTDWASLRYSEEERHLSLPKDWEGHYIKKILPNKISLSADYVNNHNFLIDLKIILKTIFKASKFGLLSRIYIL